MVQSEAPLYALQVVVDPLQDGHLLANPRLGPEVGGAEHGTEVGGTRCHLSTVRMASQY